jgi:cytoskeletal protein CcmA (bactofilin family)
MAIFGKKKLNQQPLVEDEAAATVPPVAESPEPESAPMPLLTPVPAAAGPVAEPRGSKLIVGPNIRLTGSEITDCDTVIIEGRVEATVDGREMQIAETGVFSGTVAIDMAEIRGQFQGELTVRKRLTVCGTGKVSGHIRYGTLVVEEGGELSGDVDALRAAQSGTAKRSSPSEGKVTLPVVTVTPAAGNIPSAG